MSKKGQELLLAEETVKLIIAAVCIGFLILLAVFLYNLFASNQEFGTAKSSLNNLINGIGSGYTKVSVFNPTGWFLASFPTTLFGPLGGLPKLCSSNGWSKCICICKIPSEGLPGSGDCDINLNGYCVQSDFTISPEREIVLGSGSKDALPLPVTLSIDKQNKLISLSSL